MAERKGRRDDRLLHQVVKTPKVNRSSGKIQNGNPIRLKRVSRRFNLLRCLQLHCHVTITARALPHVIFGLNESRCHPIAALTRQGTWLENSYWCNGKALKKKKKGLRHLPHYHGSSLKPKNCTSNVTFPGCPERSQKNCHVTYLLPAGRDGSVCALYRWVCLT